MKTILLLTISNIFMTFAWYGHLRYRSAPLWLAITASWGIAFFEYCFQVPANRWGFTQFSAPQLKILQEVITLTVFAIFSMWYLHQRMRWNDWAAFGCIILAVAFTFAFGEPRPGHETGDAGTATSNVSQQSNHSDAAG